MSRSKFEIMAEKELEADNWLVDWKIRPSGFRNPRGYAVDFFGLFDLLAYSKGVIRGIAIKGQGGVPRELRIAIEEFDAGDHFIKEIWKYSQPTKKGKRIKSAKYKIRKEIV